MKRPGLLSSSFASLFLLACGDTSPDLDGTSDALSRYAAQKQRAACQNAAPLKIVGGDVAVMPSCGETGGLPLGLDGRHVLFMNFDGVDVRGGDTSLENQGLRNTMADLPPVISLAPFAPASAKRDEDILKIWRKVADFYADFNVDVMISRPLSGDYMMTIVGDLKEKIGLGGSIVGISPGDCRNSSETNTNYAFSGSLRENPDQVAVTIAHEAGHAYGLGHTMNMKDIMYPSVSPAEGFLEGEVADPGPCNAMQFDRQDSHGVLEANLGLRPPGAEPVGKSKPPVVAVTSPKEGETVGRDVTLAVTASSESRGGIDHVTVSLSLADGGKFRGAHPVAELRPPSSAAQVRLSAPGNYELTATAYDQFGNLAMTRTHFTVSTITCTVPNDCAAGQKCLMNTCVTPQLPPTSPTGNPDDALRAPGSACDQSSECRDGFCGITPVGQICTAYCGGGRLCDPALECVDGICQPPMFSQTMPKTGQLGGKCSRKEDCFTGECSPFVDAATPRYCTRGCDPEIAWTCPSNMACSEGDTASGKRNICQVRPIGQTGEGGGCSQGGRGSSGAGILTLLAMVGCLVFLRRRQSMYS